MTSRLLPAALLTALALSAPAAARADDVYKAPGGEFEVKLPAEPAVQTQEKATFAGKMKMTLYTAGDNDTNAVYTVMSCELPAPLLETLKKQPENTLDSFVTGVLTGAMAKKTAVRNVKMGSHSGREFEAAVFEGEGRMAGRVFLINDKVYVLMVMVPKDTDVAAAARGFFESFKINSL